MEKPRLITENEMQQLLKEVYRLPPEENLLWALSQRVSDPTAPVTEKSAVRLHPLLLSVLLVLIATIGILIYLSWFKV